MAENNPLTTITIAGNNNSNNNQQPTTKNNTPPMADPLDAGVGAQQPTMSLSHESDMAQGGWFHLVGGPLRPFG